MSRRIDWPALERASSLLALLPEDARQTARLMELENSQQLFCRGDRPNAMYFVITGEVHLVRRSRAGAEIVLQKGLGGRFVAEASLEQAAYHCDAVIVAPSTIVMVTRKDFLAALDEPEFARGWMRYLAQELRRARMLAERLSLRSAPDRIMHYIESEGENGVVALRQSKKEWAAELGLTHEALYRSLARMQRAGQIHIDDRWQRFVYPEVTGGALCQCPQ